MKTLCKPKSVLRKAQGTIFQMIIIIEYFPKNISIRELLALLIILPFSVGYLGIVLKALFIVSTSQELSEIADALLFPIPLITILTLVLNYYFKYRQSDDAAGKSQSNTPKSQTENGVIKADDSEIS